MKDIKGLKFGKLKALEYLGNSKWLCQCDCGNFAEINSYKLRSGHTCSCGCLTKTQKGESHTRLCQIYRAMKSRCYNLKNNRYKHYGAKGIKICDEWLKDFQAFKNWALKNGYADNLTIDRIDVNEDYKPSNCRWTNYTTQNRNKNNTLKYSFNGVEKHCLNGLKFKA